MVSGLFHGGRDALNRTKAGSVFASNEYCILVSIIKATLGHPIISYKCFELQRFYSFRLCQISTPSSASRSHFSFIEIHHMTALQYYSSMCCSIHSWKTLLYKSFKRQNKCQSLQADCDVIRGPANGTQVPILLFLVILSDCNEKINKKGRDLKKKST